MMMDEPKDARGSQAALARALGISKAAVSKCKAQGMPVHSIEAAAAWRREHLDPARTKRSIADTYAEPLAEVAAIWPIAAAALAAGRLEMVLPRLRLALRAVPPRARHLVLVDVDVMNALCAPFVDACRELVDEESGACAPLTEAEADVMGDVWYCIAAGESFPASWLEG